MIREHNPIVTIITPTTGKRSLYNLIDSIKGQGVPVCHLLLWDEVRQDDFMMGKKPEELVIESDWENNNYLLNNIQIKASSVNGIAAGSALRSIGLMAAQTDLVTFADDDVIYHQDHLITMMETLHKEKTNWVFCKREIWTKISPQEYECLGIDEFESVGDECNPSLGYEMVDNSSMMFKRRFGTSGAVLYRETAEYNDDRLFYNFLKKHAGPPARTRKATVSQVCPPRLQNFFRKNCTKIKNDDIN